MNSGKTIDPNRIGEFPKTVENCVIDFMLWVPASHQRQPIFQDVTDLEHQTVNISDGINPFSVCFGLDWLSRIETSIQEKESEFEMEIDEERSWDSQQEDLEKQNTEAVIHFE